MLDNLDNNTGLIFKNKNKEKEEHPDWTGDIKVGDKDYVIVGYVKASKATGEKFLKLLVREQDDFLE